jgi:hypothetical protein
MNNDTNVRGTPRSTLKSNPRKAEDDIRMDNLKDMFHTTTIMDSMNRIMELIEDNRRIKRGK